MSHRGPAAGDAPTASMHEASQPDVLYSIGKTVAELQRYFPDVSHSSLRFLEREGLLEPHRTEGGHRKFRASDIERVRTIKEWQLQHLSLGEIRQRLEVMDRMPSSEQIWRRYLDLALEGRIEEAAMVILNADEAGLPLVETYQDVLAPALVELGKKWAEGTAKVGQEHEVSELTRDLIADLSARHAGRGEEEFAVVAACVHGELHDLGLRMVSGLLRQRDVRVHFLGASVATTFLVESVIMRQPDAVVLSVTIDQNRPALLDAIRALRNAVPRQMQPVIVVGGPGEMDLSSGDLGEVRAMWAKPMGEAVDEILQLCSRS